MGELLLRLATPRGEMFATRPDLGIDVGGSEANVAANLAVLGHGVTMLSAVPDSALGDTAITGLRASGVDCSSVIRSAGRMGLYWVETGAGLRPTEVIYDRAASAFASSNPTDWHWPTLLAGADRLHLSGITPALSHQSADLAHNAADTATAVGIPISFDGNYRGLLWAARGGVDVPALVRLVSTADILLGNYKDIGMLLGMPLDGATADQRKAASDAAFAAFPKLRLIASTSRRTVHADRHGLTVRVDTRDDAIETEEVDLASVVDRIGSGDAFTAGILHADKLGLGIAEIAQHGLALGALKHSLRGDHAPLSERHIARFVSGMMDVHR